MARFLSTIFSPDRRRRINRPRRKKREIQGTYSRNLIIKLPRRRRRGSRARGEWRFHSSEADINCAKRDHHRGFNFQRWDNAGGEGGNSIFPRKEIWKRNRCTTLERCKNNKCKKRGREREKGEQKEENVHAGKKRERKSLSTVESGLCVLFRPFRE